MITHRNLPPAIILSLFVLSSVALASIPGLHSNSSFRSMLRTTAEQANARAAVVDPAGNSWVLVADEGRLNVRVKKYNPRGTVIDSVALPHQGDNAPMSMILDKGGNCWVLGNHYYPPSTNAGYSILYKINPACHAVLDSVVLQTATRIYDLGFALALDARGNLWCAGGIITDTSNNSFKFKQALWKIGLDGKLVAGYPKFYQRGFNGDLSFSLSVDASGFLWSSGISSGGSVPYDGAVWKFDTTGTLAAGFPKFVPSVFPNLDQISVGSGNFGSSFWLATTMYHNGVGDLGLFQFDAAGAMVSQRFWHTTSRTTATVRNLYFDLAGNFFILGDTGSVNGNRQSVIWYYTSAGNLVSGFPQRFDASVAAIDVDGGNLLMYSGSGITKFQGSVTISGDIGPTSATGPFSGYANAMEFDRTGNLWVQRFDITVENPINNKLIKYNTSLQPVDSTSFPICEFGPPQRTIAFDTAGNALFLNLRGDGNFNNVYFSIYRVNRNGSPVIDSVSYRSTYKLMDMGFGMVVDRSNNVWVTGAIITDTTGMSNSGPSAFRFAIWKYTLSPSLQLAAGFPKTYQRGFNGDASFATAMDDAGNVFAVGPSRNAAGNFDIGIWKYDGSGALAAGYPAFIPNWMDNPGDPLMPIVIRGSSLWVACAKKNASVYDLALLKLDLAGNVLLRKFWHTSARTNVAVTNLALDQNGDPLVVGSLRPPVGSDVRVVWRYDATGQLIDTRQMNGTGFAVDKDGGIRYGGSGKVMSTLGPSVSYGSEGPTTNSVSVSGEVSGLLMDAQGNFRVALRTKKNNEWSTYRWRKISSTLSPMDSVTFPPVLDYGFSGTTFDGSGNGYFQGTQSPNNKTVRSVFYKVNPAGNAVIDSFKIASTYGLMDMAGGLTIDDNGNFWSAGLVTTDSTGMDAGIPAKFQFALWKYSSTGVVAAGYPKYYARGYNKDGAVATYYDSPSKSVFAAGISQNASGLFDATLWKYDLNGNLAAGFPIFAPDFFQDLDNFNASLTVRNNAVWVCTPFGLPGRSALVLMKISLDGTNVTGTYWHPNGDAAVGLKSMSIDVNGTVWVVGDTGSTNGNRRSVLWAFTPDANLQFGFPRILDGNGLVTDGSAAVWTVQNGLLQTTVGGSYINGGWGVFNTLTSVPGDQQSLPGSFALNQNYPNPFNPTTVISYQLSALSDAKLSVFDVLGREVAIVAMGIQSAGRHTVTFDGSRLGSGVYFYVLRAGAQTAVRKMLLIR